MKSTHKYAAAFATGTLVLMLAAPAALAATGEARTGATAGGDDTYTSVSETVQVVMNADADVAESRLITQVTAYGTGTVDLKVPSPAGLRDLGGYSAPAVSDGHASYQLSVDGDEARKRTVATFDKDLPVEIDVEYTLDGEPVDAGDVVGRSGDLVATYHIENVTAEEREVTYAGGDGKDVTETVTTVIPLVGTLSTTLPGRFTNVSAPDAAMGGDGRGSNQVQWSLVLFEPVGAPTADVSYSAHITDGEIPATTLQLAVVAPDDMAATRSAGEQYADGSHTGAELTDGAIQIDENLLKLKAGAGELLAGLQKLSDGATQLSEGLNDKAVPGSERLAAGAAELAKGLNDKAAPGSKQLAAGASKLEDGAADLAAGLDTLSGGLSTLNGRLPAAVLAVNSLIGGANEVLLGLGNENAPITLIGGAHRLGLGLSNPDATADPATWGAKQGVDAARSGANQVKAGLDAALQGGGSIDQLAGGVNALSALCAGIADPTDRATCAGTAQAVLDGINGTGGLREKTVAASAGLGQVSGGLGQVSGGLTTAAAGAGTLESGLKQLKVGVSNPAANPANTATWGIKEGLVGLADALSAAVTGVGQLSAGADAAATGGEQLAGGAGQVSAGASDLADGLTPAGAGAKLLADGADELAKGLAPAGDGAQKISDGLAQAAPGAEQIEDGAGRLSEEGTQKLVEAGKETAATFGSKYGQIVALNERAAESRLVYGNADADAQTSVFSYELAGANAEPQQNAFRALGAILALAAGTGVAALATRRRRRT